MLLHQKSRLTELLVRDLHLHSVHADPSIVHSLLTESYFFVVARHLVKAISQYCIPCQNIYVRAAMVQLPEARVNPSPPFSATGIDFAGSLITKRGNPRKSTRIKSYVCLFVCLYTCSVHLELCSDLSTSSFMAALTRFVAWRGLPHSIYSDNGTNFIRAYRELADCYNLLNPKVFQKVVSHLASSKCIIWHFSPARVLHFGGICEAGVNSRKKIFRKTLPPHLLNFEEFSTLLADVEAVFNSWPLLPLNTALPDGYLALTSGHFLVGRPLKALFLSGYEDDNLVLLKRWDLVRRLSHDI